MAKQKVTEKILQDAKKEAQEILAKYKKEASAVKDEYAEKIAVKKRQIETEVESIKKAEILQAVSQKRIELKKQLSFQKYKLIKEITEDSLKKLTEHKKYLDFLKNLIKKSGVEKGELIMTGHDIKRYRSDLEKFLKRAGLNYPIKTSNDLKGGVIVKKGKTTYLGSLDLISELSRDELAIAVSKILY